MKKMKDQQELLIDEAVNKVSMTANKEIESLHSKVEEYA